MKKFDKNAFTKEWQEILKTHPAFARVFLAQQMILIEASERGSQFIDRRMCGLLRTGLPVLFRDHWTFRCEEVDAPPLPELFSCLLREHGDPSKCFANPYEDVWISDPVPHKLHDPKPPLPHTGIRDPQPIERH